MNTREREGGSEGVCIGSGFMAVTVFLMVNLDLWGEGNDSPIVCVYVCVCVLCPYPFIHFVLYERVQNCMDNSQHLVHIAINMIVRTSQKLEQNI